MSIRRFMRQAAHSPSTLNYSMNAPLISICIPAYNAEQLLPAAMESVRSVQQPVRYDRHEQTLGLSATRNTSIAVARGKSIALLDADDVWTTENLEATTQGRVFWRACQYEPFNPRIPIHLAFTGWRSVAAEIAA
jgi:glycosyltransferase involved in cell wall biosynthesis